MVDREKIEILTRGGVYLVKLNPVKRGEAGKIRPAIILTSQTILNINPVTAFICPLSKKSFPAFHNIHVELPARDNLQVKSFALIDHCRSASIDRFIFPRIAQLTMTEMELILHRLQIMLE